MMKAPIAFSMLIASIAVITNSNAHSQTTTLQQRKPGDNPIRVALFADPGSTQEKSRDAIFNLLSNRKDIQVDNVTTETVRAHNFTNNYDVFILPGGSGGGEASAIGVEGGKQIAAATHDGKGLIAICAGGYYVAKGWGPATSALDVINAENHDGKHWARGAQFINVKTVGQTDDQSSKTMWFENGPIFVPATMEDMPKYVPLVTYVTDLAAKDAPTGQMAGNDAVIAAQYGKGRVVAFGPHPELSPQVNHWLINAIHWASKPDTDSRPINVDTVLEGKAQ